MFDDFDTQVQCEEVYTEQEAVEVDDKVDDLVLEAEVKTMMEFI